MNLRSKMRVGDVVRWNIVRTARSQTLAEHLYRTWLISDRLFTELVLPESTRETVLHWALTHDLPEVFTGDLPTPTKRSIETRADDLDIWKKLERDVYPETMQKLIAGTPAAFIVKIADCLEGGWFLEVEGIGAHALDTRHQMYQRAIAVAEQAQDAGFGQHWVEATRRVMLELLGRVEHCS